MAIELKEAFFYSLLHINDKLTKIQVIVKLLFYLCTPSTMRKKDRRSAGMKRVSEIPNYNALVKIIMKLGLVWLQGGIKCASR